MDTASTGARTDALLATALAAVLGGAATVRDRAGLAALRLPDTDDLLRLQQVRDWLGGQPWGDLAQHRLGAGAPMHWSRLADLGPAAIVSALTPLFGRHPAEVAMVVAWPLILFAAALFLAARVARAVGAPGPTAALVAGLGFPATLAFAPGRIDHHGLQVVLLLGAVLAALRGRGAVVGLLAAASLVVGMEMTPVLAALAGAMLADWVAAEDRTSADRRLLGLGLGALGGLVLGRLAFAGSGWDYPACDAFDARSWRAGLALAAAPLPLAALRLGTVRSRAVAAGLACVAASGVALALAPECLSPYGGVGPELRRLWLSRVEEAQGILSAPPATSFEMLGLGVAGLAACLWRLRRGRSRGWALLVMVQAAALLVACVQLRGSYAAAILAAPALAAAVASARAQGPLRLAGAWAASAGLLYPLAAGAVSPVGDEAADDGACDSPALLRRLAALPPGVVMAPVDAGSAMIAATPHRVVAAPYHRNGEAILAAIRFYKASPTQAARIARAWRVDYAISCEGHPARGAALARLADGSVVVRP